MNEIPSPPEYNERLCARCEQARREPGTCEDENLDCPSTRDRAQAHTFYVALVLLESVCCYLLKYDELIKGLGLFYVEGLCWLLPF